MKIISKEEDEAHSRAVLEGGLKTAGATLVGTLALAGALQKARWKPFTQLTMPLKVFAITAATSSAAIVGGDRASLKFDRELYKNIGHRDANLEKSLGISSTGIKGTITSSSLMDEMLHFGRENKWSLVGASWATAMIGSFAYISTTPLSFAQKLVQARVYAQAITVIILIASAALASTAEKKEKLHDREHAMYKFKKDN